MDFCSLQDGLRELTAILKLCVQSAESKQIYDALKTSMVAGELDVACGQRATRGAKVEQVF